jgi:hypothetical protein
MTVAGIESTAPVFNDGKRSEAVVLSAQTDKPDHRMGAVSGPSGIGWETSISA